MADGLLHRHAHVRHGRVVHQIRCCGDGALERLLDEAGLGESRVAVELVVLPVVDAALAQALLKARSPDQVRVVQPCGIGPSDLLDDAAGGDHDEVLEAVALVVPCWLVCVIACMCT